MSARIVDLARRFGRPVLGVVLGAGLGFAYASLVGCPTGGCPITSNPYLASAIGALLGLSFAGTGRPREK